MLRIPDVTYRLRSFDEQSVARTFERTFEDMRKLVGYLERSSISDLSIPPVLQAREGTGRRAVVDPSRIDDALGGAKSFAALSADLADAGLGLHVDLVADRLVATTHNPFFRDLLLRGEASPCAEWFDVDWDRGPGGSRGRVVLPILEAPYGESLANGAVRVAFGPEGFVVKAAGLLLPVRLSTWRFIIGRRHGVLQAAFGANHPAVSGIQQILNASFDDGMDRAGAARQLDSLVQAHPPAAVLVDEGVRALTPPGNEETNLLHILLEQQHYRLAWADGADDALNYRVACDRDVIGARVEDKEALEGMHQETLQRIRRGQIAGVRVRDIDQIGDPARLLASLREVAGDAASLPYLSVEKRCLGDERIPSEWPVSGGDGHDFAAATTRLMTDPAGLATLSQMYTGLPGRSASDGPFAHRREVLQVALKGELDRLMELVVHAAERDRSGRDIPRAALREALTELAVHVPVYRTYLNDDCVREEDRVVILRAVQLAAASGADPRALEFVRRLLLENDPDEEMDARRSRIVRRWQQVCATAMSRAWDEAARSVDQRLSSLSEVGELPTVLPSALSMEAFHQFLIGRAANSPHAVNATGLSRSRLGEDARARISAISEMASEFTAMYRRISRKSRELKQLIDRRLAPDAATEWLIYQLALGGWPENAGGLEAFATELSAAVIERAREAATQTSEAAPNESFEGAVRQFIEALLLSGEGSTFRREMRVLRERVAFLGHFGSLSQMVLKFFAPGVPEIEEGTEVLDLRVGLPMPGAADQARHIATQVADAEQSGEASADQKGWLKNYKDGRVKALMTGRVARLRREYPALFRDGTYEPCAVEGKHADRVCVFLRRNGEQQALVAVGVRLSGVVETNRLPIGKLWADTRVVLPDGAPAAWVERLSGQTVPADGAIRCEDLFRWIPQAVCVPQ